MTWDVYETAKIGRYTVNVVHDADRSLSDAVNDEPVMIFERRGGVILDQSKRNFPSHAVLQAIGDGDDILSDLCDMSYSDWGVTTGGNYWYENSSFERRKYIRSGFGKIEINRPKLIAALFRAEYNRELSDLRVEQFGRGDSREVYYLVLWQSEFDAYCGGKDCKSSLDSCQAIIDGEVYGFTVDDDAGETLDSCWGFIGDASYCMTEGKQAAAYLESKACELDAAALESSRSDMYQKESF